MAVIFLTITLTFLSLLPIVCHTSGLFIVLVSLTFLLSVMLGSVIAFPDILTSCFNKPLQKVSASIRASQTLFAWNDGLEITFIAHDFQILSPVMFPFFVYVVQL